ncbi:sensor histidine kinase [Clostridium sp. 'deep sea']|uniref:ATP-binding protein n=1 Tax=Clostridium sp. 'deep sea' TaxID=2779445 RepID=UPI0018966B2E|nr:ATP-binding protein [Clostridium sp. 'deep sea']QOR34932.1 sensor histidine kinase [Clostridium sp. 'deep sea']
MYNIFVEDIFYVSTYPIIASLIHYFFTNCLGCRLKSKFRIFMVYSIYCLINSVIYFSDYLSNYYSFVNLLLVVALLHFYKGSYKNKLSATVFIIAIALLSDVLVKSLLVAIWNNLDSTNYIISLFVSKFVMLILTHVAVQLCTSYKANVDNLTKWYWLFLVLWPILSFISILTFHKLYPIGNFPWLYPLLTLLLLFTNFFIFILCDKVLRIKLVENQKFLLEKQINYYKNQYHLALSSQRESQRFRHDFKNILVGLYAKITTGELNSSKEMLNNMLSEFNSSKINCNSGNIVIDSIINYKQSIANNIKMNIDVRVPTSINFNALDISVILGNILDNAIEACKYNDLKNKFINIKIHYLNESLFIYIKNPYSSKIKTNFRGEILSSKLGYNATGLGLKSVKDTINKLNGIFNIDYKNKYFSIEVILFNTE